MHVVLRTAMGLGLLALLALGMNACALLPPRDPLTINMVGIDPLPSQDLEMRFAVKLRVQNPNDSAIDYDGLALDLEVNGQPLASGVSDQRGRVERYSETLLTVPLSVSAFSALRQAMGLSQTQRLDDLPYRLRGKLAGGLFGSVRFSDSGRLRLPRAASPY
jgi:LEA14-like dessication related protein